MRGLSLIGLLITLAIAAWWFTQYQQSVEKNYENTPGLENGITAPIEEAERVQGLLNDRYSE